MVTSGLFWLVLFLAVAVHWCLPRGRALFLGAVSLGYLATLELRAVGVLGVFGAATFLLAPRAARGKPGAGWLRAALITAPLACLAWFKYVPTFTGTDPLIPLGISYFTFKLIHYVLEVSRGTIPAGAPADFAAYLLFFPIFTAGPIERFDRFVRERDAKLELSAVATGLTRIVHGLIKKFVLADEVAMRLIQVATTEGILANLEAVPQWKAWVHLAGYFIYVYLDFSAYSDLAIGASRLFGVRIMENFNWPIASPSVAEYWRRWHMSLSGFCREYVYLPTIGLTRNPYLAGYSTMLVIALWHHGSVNWALWGAYHGTALALYQVFGRMKRKRKWKAMDRPRYRPLFIAATMLAVVASYSFVATDAQGPYAGFRYFFALFGLILPP